MGALLIVRIFCWSVARLAQDARGDLIR